MVVRPAVCPSKSVLSGTARLARSRTAQRRGRARCVALDVLVRSMSVLNRAYFAVCSSVVALLDVAPWLCAAGAPLPVDVDGDDDDLGDEVDDEDDGLDYDGGAMPGFIALPVPAAVIRPEDVDQIVAMGFTRDQAQRYAAWPSSSMPFLSHVSSPSESVDGLGG